MMAPWEAAHHTIVCHLELELPIHMPIFHHIPRLQSTQPGRSIKRGRWTVCWVRQTYVLGALQVELLGFGLKSVPAVQPHHGRSVGSLVVTWWGDLGESCLES